MAGLMTFPAGLPVPEDDDAADHLRGTDMPHVVLRSTDGRAVDVGNLGDRRSLIRRGNPIRKPCRR